MIKIFGALDKDFNSNGDIVVNPIKAKVHKEDNSDFYLELECGIQYVDYIVQGNIVVAPTPQGEQAFRVGNVNKNRNKITTKCHHIFYDTKNYVIPEIEITNKTAEEALQQLNDSTEPISPFHTFSNITETHSHKGKTKTYYEEIMNVVNQWGGHLIRDNFSIGVRDTIGTDNGVTIQYKKNLKDITCEENWDNVVTKLLPIGKDGVLLNELDPTSEIYITSEIQYMLPYTRAKEFTQDNIERDKYSSDQAYKQALITDLSQQAINYINKNCRPKVNYTLKANMDKITDVGDTVKVIDNRLGIELLTNVIAYDYDCLLEQYVEIEFGNFKNTLSKLSSTITSTVENNMQGVISENVDKIKSVMGDSYVAYDGSKILVMDTLPKSSAVNILKIDNNGLTMSNNGQNGTFKPLLSLDGIFNAQELTVTNFANIMTRFVGTSINAPTIETYTKIPFTITNSIGGKLISMQDGGIKVASEVTKIIVSGKIAIEGNSVGDREILITRNNSMPNNILAMSSKNIATGADELIIPPTLVDVQENDIIYMWYYLLAEDTIVAIKTMLTVEFVE